MPVLEPEDGQSLGDLARHLLALAEAEGLEGPTTDTSGSGTRFVVSEELLAAYKSEDRVAAYRDEGDEDKAAASETDKSESAPKRSRKSKGGK